RIGRFLRPVLAVFLFDSVEEFPLPVVASGDPGRGEGAFDLTVRCLDAAHNSGIRIEPLLKQKKAELADLDFQTLGLLDGVDVDGEQSDHPSLSAIDKPGRRQTRSRYREPEQDGRTRDSEGEPVHEYRD